MSLAATKQAMAMVWVAANVDSSGLVDDTWVEAMINAWVDDVAVSIGIMEHSFVLY